MINNNVTDHLTLLDQPIFSRTKKEALEKIKKYFDKFKIQDSKFKSLPRSPLVILTPNPEIIVYGQKDKKFSQILKQADLALPDGIGVLWAARILEKKKSYIKRKKPTERITGIDFMLELVGWSAKNSLTIALIGGRKNVALDALECLKNKYAGLEGWAMEGPEMEVRRGKLEVSKEKLRIEKGFGRKESEVEISRQSKNQQFNSIDQFVAAILRKIQQTKTAMVFVGLGCPKQEYLIDEMRRRLVAEKYDQPLVLMAVGGAFDMIAGRVVRAPRWLRRIGLEWLFRLVQQPWRWRRQLALLKFCWLVGRELLVSYYKE